MDWPIVSLGIRMAPEKFLRQSRCPQGLEKTAFHLSKFATTNVVRAEAEEIHTPGLVISPFRSLKVGERRDSCPI